MCHHLYVYVDMNRRSVWKTVVMWTQIRLDIMYRADFFFFFISQISVIHSVYNIKWKLNVCFRGFNYSVSKNEGRMVEQREGKRGWGSGTVVDGRGVGGWESLHEQQLLGSLRALAWAEIHTFSPCFQTLAVYVCVSLCWWCMTEWLDWSEMEMVLESLSSLWNTYVQRYGRVSRPERRLKTTSINPCSAEWYSQYSVPNYL